MADQIPLQPSDPNSRPTVVVQAAAQRRGWGTRFVAAALLVSIAVNFSLYSAYEQYISDGSGPIERLESGEVTAPAKLAMLEIRGVLMPPFTGRMIKSIDRAAADPDVRGVLLLIDSPGGLVADSHRVYHRLKQLSAKKPVVVFMERMAASGGYYSAMGAGPEATIFAEPTTWTGSIGVIIPHYNASELAEKVGVTAAPLTTGEFKDSLSPFRELSQREKDLWDAIMDDAYSRFLKVIADNRKGLTVEDVRERATGQIFTAEQARDNGLIDRIGFREDALAALKEQVGIRNLRVIRYEFQSSIIDMIAGSVETPKQPSWRQELLDASIPQAMYLCSWLPGIR